MLSDKKGDIVYDSIYVNLNLQGQEVVLGTPHIHAWPSSSLGISLLVWHSPAYFPLGTWQLNSPIT